MVLKIKVGWDVFLSGSRHEQQAPQIDRQTESWVTNTNNWGQEWDVNHTRPDKEQPSVIRAVINCLHLSCILLPQRLSHMYFFFVVYRFAREEDRGKWGGETGPSGFTNRMRSWLCRRISAEANYQAAQPTGRGLACGAWEQKGMVGRSKKRETGKKTRHKMSSLFGWCLLVPL